MIRVSVDINGRIIATYFAIRIAGDSQPDTINTYKMNTGDEFEHRFGDGAAVCVSKMMDIVSKFYMKPLPKEVDYEDGLNYDNQIV